MKRYLITGGAGFLGGHLIKKLKKKRKQNHRFRFKKENIRK